MPGSGATPSTSPAAAASRAPRPPTSIAAYRHARGAGSSHLPALDGVRGLAVLGVLLFHGGVSWMRGGFFGVDAFFVLSGFLITGLLLAEWDSTSGRTGRRIDLVAFWARRARRLLPALLLLIAAILVTAAVHPPLRDQPGLRGDIWSTLGYVANWHSIATGGDYFARTGPPSPLQHTWSLAIEEQFYLLWPLLLVLVLRLWGERRALRRIAVGGALLSAAVMALLSVGAHGSFDRIYYGTDTRAQSLLIGAALATVVPIRRAGRSAVPAGGSALPAAAPRIAGLAGCAVLAALWTTASGSDGWLYRGGFAIAAVAVAGVIWSAVSDERGPVARLLSLSPLRLLGVISYGVYLWHWPLFLALTAERTGQRGTALLALRLAATITVATVSYVFVEEPIRSRRALPRWRAPAALTTAAVVLAAVTFGAARPPSVTPAVAVRPLPTISHPPTKPPAQQGAHSGASASTVAKPVVRPAHAGPTRLLVLGDSVAETLFKYMPSYPQVDVTNDAVLGCGLLQESPYRYVGQVSNVPPECAGWPGTWAADVQRSDPDVVALLVGRWEMMDRVIDGRWQSVGDPDFDRHVMANLERVLPLLTARGARLALLTPPYYHRAERPDGGLWPEDEPARVDKFTALLRTFAAAHQDRVSIVDLGKLMNPPGQHAYSAYINGVFARYDGVHVTPAAAALLAPELLPQLIALDPRAQH